MSAKIESIQFAIAKLHRTMQSEIEHEVGLARRRVHETVKARHAAEMDRLRSALEAADGRMIPAVEKAILASDAPKPGTKVRFRVVGWLLPVRSSVWCRVSVHPVVADQFSDLWCKRHGHPPFRWEPDRAGRMSRSRMLYQPEDFEPPGSG